jgi:hypothetical protein
VLCSQRVTLVVNASSTRVASISFEQAATDTSVIKLKLHSEARQLITDINIDIQAGLQCYLPPAVATGAPQQQQQQQHNVALTYAASASGVECSVHTDAFDAAMQLAHVAAGQYKLECKYTETRAAVNALLPLQQQRAVLLAS